MRRILAALVSAVLAVQPVMAQNTPYFRIWGRTDAPVTPVDPPTGGGNTLIVLASPTPPSVATVGDSVSSSLVASGGTGPYTFSGMNLPPGTGVSGNTFSGTFSQAGSFTYLLAAQDSFNDGGGTQFSTVVYDQLSAADYGVQSLTVGVADAISPPTVYGGHPPYRFTVTSGAVPAGMTVDSATGAVSGTPLAAGSFNASVTVSDADGRAKVVSVSGAVVSDLTFADYGSGIVSEVGIAISPMNATVSGGSGSKTFVRASGSLPPGVVLNTLTGTISGTPTASGSYSAVIRVSDAGGRYKDASVSFSVAPALAVSYVVTPSSSLSGGQAYSYSIQTTGGVGAVSLATTGSVPPGFTLANGVLSGSPTALGTYTFGVRATDSLGATASTPDVTSTVTAGTIQVTIYGPLTGAVNTPITMTSAATDGILNTYQWSNVGGALPTGFYLDPATGTITGTPQSVGYSNIIQLKATDAASGRTGLSIPFRFLTTTVLANFSISYPSSMSGQVGTAFYTPATKATAGGTAPFSYAIHSGSLPPGLTLDAATGGISGVPTTAGTYGSISIKQMDNSGKTAVSNVFSMTVAPAPVAAMSVYMNGSTNGQKDLYYSVGAVAANAQGAVTWSISWTAPAGLSFNQTTGVISGTPTASGTTPNVTVTGTDAAGNTASTTFSIAIAAAPSMTVYMPSWTATVNTAFSGSATAGGGTSPYDWTLAAGTLPSGLSLNRATGTISGTPTAVGVSSGIQLTATDSKGVSRSSAAFSITVNPTPAWTISYPSNGSYARNTTFTVSPTITGKTGTFTYQLTSGSLPSGLTFNTSTGVITGSTATAGSIVGLVVTATADDSTTAVSQGFTIYIKGTGTLIVDLPTEIPPGVVGDPYQVQYTARGSDNGPATAPVYWKVVSGQLLQGLSLDPATGIISGTTTIRENQYIQLEVVDSQGRVGTSSGYTYSSKNSFVGHLEIQGGAYTYREVKRLDTSNREVWFVLVTDGYSWSPNFGDVYQYYDYRVRGRVYSQSSIEGTMPPTQSASTLSAPYPHFPFDVTTAGTYTFRGKFIDAAARTVYTPWMTVKVVDDVIAFKYTNVNMYECGGPQNDQSLYGGTYQFDADGHYTSFGGQDQPTKTSGGNNYMLGPVSADQLGWAEGQYGVTVDNVAKTIKIVGRQHRTVGGSIVYGNNVVNGGSTNFYAISVVDNGTFPANGWVLGQYGSVNTSSMAGQAGKFTQTVKLNDYNGSGTTYQVTFYNYPANPPICGWVCTNCNTINQ